MIAHRMFTSLASRSVAVFSGILLMLIGFSANVDCASAPRGWDIVFVQVHKEQGNLEVRDPVYGYSGRCRILRGSAINPESVPIVLSAAFFSAMDPVVSFDGKTLLFAAKKTKDDFWQIYRMNTDGSELVQITSGNRDHVSPLFVGTLFYLNDTVPVKQITYQSKAPSSQGPWALFASNTDGTNVRQITFNHYPDIDPDVLPNGRLVFSSVVLNQRRSEVPTARLMAVNIDGTDLMPFTGDQGPPQLHQQKPRIGHDGRVYYIESPSSEPLSGGQLVYVRKDRPLHSRKVLSPASTGWYQSPCSLPDGRLLASYKTSPDGVYGIHRIDPETGKSIDVIHQSPEYHCLDAQVLVSRSQARGRSSVVGFKHKDSGVFFCMDVYVSDQPDVQALVRGSVKQVMVTEAYLPAAETGTPADQNQARLSPFSPHPLERIIGTAPVEADGSFHVRVPAQIPLTFRLLDANGKTLARQESWTWVMPGESRGCIGCHEDRELSPPNRMVDAMRKLEVRITPPSEKRPTLSLPKQSIHRETL